MANDVEDFGDFASACPPNGATTGENFTQGTTSCVSQVNTTSNMDFFASLPAPTLSTSGVTDPSLDFTSFDAFTKHNAGGVGLGEISDFGQFDVANMNLAELKIPSPAHDSNVHLAGGVAFDIPPIPDDDFSDPGSPTVVNNQAKLQHDLFSINTTLPIDKNESSVNVHLSFPSLLTPPDGQQEQDGKGNAGDDGFGDFESSLSITKPKNFTESSNVVSNFALFEDNSVSASSVAESKAQEATRFGKPHSDTKSGEFTTSINVAKTESSSITHLGNSLDVGSFTSIESTSTTKVESKESESNNKLVPEISRTDDFAGFADFQSSEATKTNEENGQLGDFGVFAGIAGTTVAQEDDFGSFGDFQTLTGSSTAPLPATTTADTKVDHFGAFADSTGKANEFGAFASTSSGDGFGAFADGKHNGGQFGVFVHGNSKDSGVGTFAERESKGDDFGAFTGDESEFGAFAEGTSKDSEFGAFTDVTSKEEFGAFAGSLGKDDEFGDFSSTGDSNFGDFSSSVTVPIPRTSGDEAKHKVCVPCCCG